jgi:hypothetical protein
MTQNTLSSRHERNERHEVNQIFSRGLNEKLVKPNRVRYKSKFNKIRSNSDLVFKNPLINPIHSATSIKGNIEDKNVNGESITKNIIENVDSPKENAEALTSEESIDEVIPAGLLLDESVFNLQALFNIGKQGIPFLVDKLIPQEAITIFAGESDTGKSTLSTQLAINIIQGNENFIGSQIHAKHNKVIYVCTEDGPYTMGHRLRTQFGPDFNPSEYSESFRMVVDFQTMKSEIEKTNVDLIIVDTFADFFKDDMNSATMVRDFFNTQMKPLIRKYGVTFLILHHLGKGRKSERTSKDQLVGSGSIEAAARQVLFMLKVNYDTRKIKVVKGNYLSEEDKKNEILLKMDSKKLLFQKVENSDLISKVNLPGNESQPSNNISVSTPNGKRKNGPTEEQMKRAFSLRSEGMSYTKIAEVVGVRSHNTVRRWLKKTTNVVPSTEK